MPNFITKSLMNKLIGLLLGVALVPIIIVGYLSFNNAKSALKEDAFNKLAAVEEIKKGQIRSYLEERMRDMTVLAFSDDIKWAFEKLNRYHDSSGATPTGPFDVNSEEYQKIYNEIDPFFRKYLNIYGYYDIFFICAAHGHVMYTVAEESDPGANLATGSLSNSGLEQLWKKVKIDRKVTMVDYSNYEPSGEPAMFVGAPVLDDKGQVYAVVALQISTKQIDAIMQEKTGLGESGETYLVGEDLLMRSDSRFENISTILKKKIDTDASQHALQHKSGTGIIENYRDESVLSSYTHVELNELLGTDFDWAIISEIDESEAFAAVSALRFRIIWISILIALLVALVAYFSARTIAKPLSRISEQVVKVSEGDLTIEAPSENRADEVGILMRAFRSMIGFFQEVGGVAEQVAAGDLTVEVKPRSERDVMGNALADMVENIREQTREIMEGINVLAASASQISTSVAQFASSATETATAVSETTATVEEVRQTSEVSSQKARDVSENAQQVAQISQIGEKSTEDTIKEMNRIREQMESIADSVVTLSEQSQTIGEIIATVDDLTERSNLLAVNASIEAAKAGEQGKGFTVVAEEIRSLAEQSKQATAQVRTILNDIQTATSTAVMVTEQGSKAVDVGMKQSIEAGEAIRQLTSSVAASAQAAIQIAASSQQQLVGMDQITVAMESIKQGSDQNVDSANQLETATQNLNELGQRLRQLVEQYKV